MPVRFLFIAVFVVSASAFAESDLPSGSPNEEFFEFLADLENINDVWMHPIDFNYSSTDKTNMTTNKTTNKTTAAESNNE